MNQEKKGNAHGFILLLKPPQFSFLPEPAKEEPGTDIEGELAALRRAKTSLEMDLKEAQKGRRDAEQALVQADFQYQQQAQEWRQTLLRAKHFLEEALVGGTLPLLAMEQVEEARAAVKAALRELP